MMWHPPVMKASLLTASWWGEPAAGAQHTRRETTAAAGSFLGDRRPRFRTGPLWRQLDRNASVSRRRLRWGERRRRRSPRYSRAARYTPSETAAVSGGIQALASLSVCCQLLLIPTVNESSKVGGFSFLTFTLTIIGSLGNSNTNRTDAMIPQPDWWGDGCWGCWGCWEGLRSNSICVSACLLLSDVTILYPRTSICFTSIFKNNTHTHTSPSSCCLPCLLFLWALSSSFTYTHLLPLWSPLGL